MLIEVFIENEAGKPTKNIYNEKTFAFDRSLHVSRPYPYPYGFIVGTTAQDGDNVDCYVLTRRPVARGQRVMCRPVALMEQHEDNEVDHNIIAVPADEPDLLTSGKVEDDLREFVLHVFDHIPSKRISVGRFRDRQAAIDHVRRHLDVGRDPEDAHV